MTSRRDRPAPKAPPGREGRRNWSRPPSCRLHRDRLIPRIRAQRIRTEKVAPTDRSFATHWRGGINGCRRPGRSSTPSRATRGGCASILRARAARAKARSIRSNAARSDRSPPRRRDRGRELAARAGLALDGELGLAVAIVRLDHRFGLHRRRSCPSARCRARCRVRGQASALTGQDEAATVDRVVGVRQMGREIGTSQLALDSGRAAGSADRSRRAAARVADASSRTSPLSSSSSEWVSEPRPP